MKRICYICNSHIVGKSCKVGIFADLNDRFVWVDYILCRDCGLLLNETINKLKNE